MHFTIQNSSTFSIMACPSICGFLVSKLGFENATKPNSCVFFETITSGRDQIGAMQGPLASKALTNNANKQCPDELQHCHVVNYTKVGRGRSPIKSGSITFHVTWTVQYFLMEKKRNISFRADSIAPFETNDEWIDKIQTHICTKCIDCPSWVVGAGSEPHMTVNVFPWVANFRRPCPNLILLYFNVIG